MGLALFPATGLDQPIRFAPDAPPAELAGYDGPARLLAAWRRWCGDRAMPRRSDIEPLDIPDLLSALALLEADGADFRFLLVGETVSARYGHRLKGRRLGELMTGRALRYTLDEHRQCAPGANGLLVDRMHSESGLDDVQRYVRLILPISDSDGRCRYILAIMQFAA